MLTLQEIENLTRMIKLFPGTKQIYLEDNYRSTGAILAASIAIISEGNAIYATLRRM
jgi:DNA helicase II / ATP-dependent DNA helicase PcrA